MESIGGEGEERGEKENGERQNRNRGRTVDDLRLKSCKTFKGCGEEEYNKMIAPYFLENFWVGRALYVRFFTPVIFLILLLCSLPIMFMSVSKSGITLVAVVWFIGMLSLKWWCPT